MALPTTWFQRLWTFKRTGREQVSVFKPSSWWYFVACILRKTTHRSLGLIVPVFWVVPWSSQSSLPVAPSPIFLELTSKSFFGNDLSAFLIYPTVSSFYCTESYQAPGFSYHLQWNCIVLALLCGLFIIFLQPEDWFLCPPHSPQKVMFHGCSSFLGKKKKQTWRFGYQIISSIVNLVVNSFRIVTILMFLHISKLLADVTALGIFLKLHPKRWWGTLPWWSGSQTLHNKDLACRS